MFGCRICDWEMPCGVLGLYPSKDPPWLSSDGSTIESTTLLLPCIRSFRDRPTWSCGVLRHPAPPCELPSARYFSPPWIGSMIAFYSMTACVSKPLSCYLIWLMRLGDSLRMPFYGSSCRQTEVWRVFVDHRTHTSRICVVEGDSVSCFKSWLQFSTRQGISRRSWSVILSRHS